MVGFQGTHAVAPSAPPAPRIRSGDLVSGVRRLLSAPFAVEPWLGRAHEQPLRSLPPTRRYAPRVALALGVLGTILVVYLTAQNDHASPSGFAVGTRVVIISSLLAAGAYMVRDPTRRRFGSMVLGVALLACAWLLNGAARSLPFTIGVAAAPLMVGANCLLLLAHPRGYLRGRVEARLLASAIAAAAALWWALMLISPDAPFSTPLLRCGRNCSSNLLFSGHATDGFSDFLIVLAVGAWVALHAAVVAQLAKRVLSACAPARRMLYPIAATAAAQLAFLVAFLIADGAGGAAAQKLGGLYLAAVAAIPAAVFIGIALERQFLGVALARYIGVLSRNGNGVEGAMATALEDPSLEILFKSERTGGYVDADGVARQPPGTEDRRGVVEIRDDGEAVGLVAFDQELGDMRRFVIAAAEAAALALRTQRLQAEVAASYLELNDVRRRALNAAATERVRIQRDLHDSAQQRLLAIRARMRTAEQELLEDVPRLELMREMETELDAAFEEIRDAITRTHPAVLSDFGVRAALRAACRRCTPPAVLAADGVGRYPREIENAVYYTCLEALQNVQKHAGPEARPAIAMRDAGDALYFEICDQGVGFDQRGARAGNGIRNMRERLESVGGQVLIRSPAAGGTIVSGRVPLMSRLPAGAGPRS